MLGVYRARPIYRITGYVAPVGTVALLLYLGFGDFVPKAPLPFATFFVVAVAFNCVYALRLATERLAVTETGIEHTVFGVTKTIRYDEIAEIHNRPRRELDPFRVTGSTRIGDGSGTRLLVTGFLSQYDEIVIYISSRIGGREMRRCPPTTFEKLQWVVAGFGVLCMVLFLFWGRLTQG